MAKKMRVDELLVERNHSDENDSLLLAARKLALVERGGLVPGVLAVVLRA